MFILYTEVVVGVGQAQVKQQGSCAEMDLPYLECVKK
jgi:hypothetical protein